MRKNNLKRVALVAALVAVVGVGGSLAYFTDTDTKTNVVTMGNVGGSLDEDSEDGTPTEDGYEYDDVKPGDELDKQPDVTLNADSQDAYVRVKVEVTSDSADITDAMKREILDGLTGVSADWVKGENPTGTTGVVDYYYYQPVLTAGVTTSKVFTTVNVPTTWGNSITDASFQILVTAEIIQAANMEDVIETNDADQIISWGTVVIENAE